MSSHQIVLDWVVAVGTIGAAVVPFAMYLYERRSRQRAEKAIQAEQRKGLARNVTVVCDDHGGIRDDMPLDYPVEVTATVGNHGSMPVTHVLCAYEHNAYASVIGRWPMVMPGQQVKATRTVQYDPDDPRKDLGQAPTHYWVEFTDAENQRWRRRPNGSVEQLETHV